MHDVAELLPFYLNGTLDAAERARVDAELATCTSCARELSDLRALAASLRARAEANVRDLGAIRERTLARIGSPRPAVASKRAAWWIVPLRYAAASVLVFCGGAGAMAAWDAHEAGVRRDDALRNVVSVTYSKPSPLRQKTVPQAALPPFGARVPQLAKHARLTVRVPDVAAASHAALRIGATIPGAVTVLSSLPRNAARDAAVRVRVVVGASRLEATVERLAALGAIASQTISVVDRSTDIDRDASRLAAARDEQFHPAVACTAHVSCAAARAEYARVAAARVARLRALRDGDLRSVALAPIDLTLAVR